MVWWNHRLIFYWLVANDVIYSIVIYFIKFFVDYFLAWVSNESWHENSLIIISLYESMNCITISLNWSDNNTSVFIFKFFRSLVRNSSSRDSFLLMIKENFYRKKNKFYKRINWIIFLDSMREFIEYFAIIL
jgi:hypothetical protein